MAKKSTKRTIKNGTKSAKKSKTTKVSFKHPPSFKNDAQSKKEFKDYGTTYKEGILSSNNNEENYDKIFEQKLAENYKMFRELKEHRLQMRKLVGIIVFLLIIILAALLLLTFS